MASQRMPKAVLRSLQLSSSQSAVLLPRHIVSTLLPQVAQLRCLPALLDTFHSIQPHIRSVLERCGQESAQSTIRQVRRQESAQSTICRVRRHLTKETPSRCQALTDQLRVQPHVKKISASHGRASHGRVPHGHASQGCMAIVGWVILQGTFDKCIEIQ
jgi:hypothetical protein